VLAICCLGLSLVGIDTTIVNVGLPAIGRGLHVGTRGLEWTVDAYLVGRYGLRLPLTLAGGFTLASGLCLLALDSHTDLLLLKLAYLLMGVGFGFANSAITNSAVCRRRGPVSPVRSRPLRAISAAR
jgi:MFS family permease